MHVRRYLGCNTVRFGEYRRSRGIYCLYFRIVDFRFLLNVGLYLLSYMTSYSEDCNVKIHFHAASNLMPRNCLRSTSHSLCLLSSLIDCQRCFARSSRYLNPSVRILHAVVFSKMLVTFMFHSLNILYLMSLKMLGPEFQSP